MQRLGQILTGVLRAGLGLEDENLEDEKKKQQVYGNRTPPFVADSQTNINQQYDGLFGQQAEPKSPIDDLVYPRAQTLTPPAQNGLFNQQPQFDLGQNAMNGGFMPNQNSTAASEGFQPNQNSTAVPQTQQAGLQNLFGSPTDQFSFQDKSSTEPTLDDGIPQPVQNPAPTDVDIAMNQGVTAGVPMPNQPVEGMPSPEEMQQNLQQVSVPPAQPIPPSNPQDAIAADAVLNQPSPSGGIWGRGNQRSGGPSWDGEIDDSQIEPIASAPTDTPASGAVNRDNMSFNDAFKDAWAKGEQTFVYKGKTYKTITKDGKTPPTPAPQANQPAAVAPTTETSDGQAADDASWASPEQTQAPAPSQPPLKEGETRDTEITVGGQKLTKREFADGSVKYYRSWKNPENNNQPELVEVESEASGAPVVGMTAEEIKKAEERGTRLSAPEPVKPDTTALANARTALSQKETSLKGKEAELAAEKAKETPDADKIKRIEGEIATLKTEIATGKADVETRTKAGKEATAAYDQEVRTRRNDKIEELSFRKKHGNLTDDEEKELQQLRGERYVSTTKRNESRIKAIDAERKTLVERLEKEFNEDDNRRLGELEIERDKLVEENTAAILEIDPEYFDGPEPSRKDKLKAEIAATVAGTHADVANKESGFWKRLGRGLWRGFEMWSQSGGQGGLAGLAGAIGAMGAGAGFSKTFEQEMRKNKKLESLFAEFKKEQALETQEMAQVEERRKTYKDFIESIKADDVITPEEADMYEKLIGVPIGTYDAREMEFVDRNGQRYVRPKKGGPRSIRDTSVPDDISKRPRTIEYVDRDGKVRRIEGVTAKDELDFRARVAENEAKREDKVWEANVRTAENAEKRYEERLEAYEKNLREVDSEIAEAEEEINQLQPYLTDLQKDPEENKTEIARTTMELSRLRGRLAGLKTKKGQLVKPTNSSK